MSKPGVLRMACAAIAICVATAISSPAQQKFETLVRFNGNDGSNPSSTLVQAANGNLYGTAEDGGANCQSLAGCGTVFEMTPEGTLAALYSLCAQTNCTDGAFPYAGLVQANNGNFYGTTYGGGAYGNCFLFTACGTIFEITAQGRLATLHSFCAQTSCDDGFEPSPVLVQAANGHIYGTTNYGGAHRAGTVFEISPAGKLSTLYSFCSEACIDGANPSAGLVQSSNGNLYGTTTAEGAHGEGTVFEITPAGKLRNLYSFCSRTNGQPYCADGAQPFAGLLQARNGNFYGTTGYGGENNGGTVFEITPAGKLTTLYSFCSRTSCSDGYSPNAALFEATNGKLYGTTAYGGGASDTCVTGCGTIFEITLAGKLTTIYSFCSENTNMCTGLYPAAALMQATNGKLYGTTLWGGDPSCYNGCGTVFTLSVGLARFVKMLPTAGTEGARIVILGDEMKGTTSVSFNGVPATFTVVSNSEITATVPPGAATGKVLVATPGGTVPSSAAFRIIPIGQP